MTEAESQSFVCGVRYVCVCGGGSVSAYDVSCLFQVKQWVSDHVARLQYQAHAVASPFPYSRPGR